MTNRDALDYWTVTLNTKSFFLTDPAKCAIECAIAALKTAIEAENRPIQRASTDKWMRIPEASDDEVKEEIRRDVGYLYDCMDEMEGRLKRIESVVFYGGKKA